MLYNAEETFIDKFIACLKKMNVTSIPFDTPSFYNGIEQMRQYFQTSRDSIGETSNEISMLFIKSPLEGNFARFRDAISEQNGWYMTFENPEYVVGTIKISNADADSILKEQDLTIPQNYLFDFTKAFCSGANIKTSSEGIGSGIS